MVSRVRRTKPVRPALHEKPGTILVMRTRRPGVDDEEERKIAIRRFESEPAYLRINAGVTKNLGNYESFRCDVAITMPCYPEEIEDMADALSEAVSNLLDEELVKYDITPPEGE